ncbi:MAG: 4Fe-4S binding protein [Rhodoferax sp.]|uniref:4Fe-4S binding protein n=1 Tax=Rhodoferax sp. TaxID=50421 RepID=UPI001B43475A|nr:4Fe-4S dicluster domain-containing protein [Rhodoferax sp.]MBP9905141.1 4Fe-4S binding protein [Rhodoferax sp.]
MAKLVAQVNTERCTGCGRCISVCPLALFVFETHDWKKRSVLREPSRCTGCDRCVAKCPVNALSLVLPRSEH